MTTCVCQSDENSHICIKKNLAMLDFLFGMGPYFFHINVTGDSHLMIHEMLKNPVFDNHLPFASSSKILKTST